MKLRERIYLKIGCILILFFISANINAEEITIFRGNYLTFGLFVLRGLIPRSLL
jgi:cadmium resistance protein CadD (predicted permease)